MATRDTLTLVHLSDIHLGGYAADATFDEDEDLRNELERDLSDLGKEIGQVDGLILGGDIAGHGTPPEFEAATSWIRSLCGLLGVSEDDVFSVPGNHDVSWGKWDADPVLQALQSQLHACPPERIRSLLEPLVTRGPYKHVLFEALADYNEFAAVYGCDIGPSRHWWSQERSLGGIRVRFTGLSSSLLGGRRDTREAATSPLALGPFKVLRTPNTINIVICHHPLEWIRDRAAAAPLIERAHLQLFGHEHAHALQRVGSGVRVHAGALHPARTGEPWEPSYNLIRLTASEASPSKVTVDIWPRRVDEKGTFGALNPNEPSESFDIDVEPSPAVRSRTEPGSPTFDAEPPSAPPDYRRVARLFMKLPTEARLTLVTRLGLLDPDSGAADIRTRTQTAFRRAVSNDSDFARLKDALDG